MIRYDILGEKFFAKNGVMKTSELKSLGLNDREIKKLVDEKIIERIKKAYYKLASIDLSEHELIAGLYPDGILCMDSALFYYGYSDKIPLEWHIGVGKDTSKSRFKIDYPYVKPYYFDLKHLCYGIDLVDYGECKLKIFDRDRLICECLKYEIKMDRETFNKAIQAYIIDPQKKISKLMDYAKQRKVTVKVHNIVGVWL